MLTIIKSIGFLLFIFIISGCTPEPVLTESMLRRKAAEADVQLLVRKAENMMTSHLLAEPYKYLDELILIERALSNAKLVYKKAKIVGWENENLVYLKRKMQTLNKPLALYTLETFQQAIDRSLILKQKKLNVEALPQYDKVLAKKALFQYVDTFNQELNQCCVERINLINHFLLSEKDKYGDVIKLTHNTMHYMGKMIRGEISEARLRDKVNQQRILVEKDMFVENDTKLVRVSKD